MGIPKPGKEPASIDEMRQVIDRASRDSPIIRNALDAAQWKGMSGEDKYVLLAYSALRELETHYQMNMKWLMLQPSPSVIEVRTIEEMENGLARDDIADAAYPPRDERRYTDSGKFLMAEKLMPDAAKPSP